MPTDKIYKTRETVAAYMQRYLDQVPDDGNLLIHLEDIFDDTRELVQAMAPNQLSYAYEDGKWTVKDILVHICDTERIFQYRALRFSRADDTALPGFAQELFAQYAGANDRTVENILRELSIVRQSSIALIESFSEQMLTRRGTASGNLISVQLICNLIYGHHKHHMNIIHEKYLKGFPHS